jgi:hypothetical protein
MEISMLSPNISSSVSTLSNGENIIGQPSRRTNNEELMAKFNMLNEEYNKMAEEKYMMNNSFFELDDNILNLNEEKIFTMIHNANNCIKKINEQNRKIHETLDEYDILIKKCNDLTDGMEKLSKNYNDLIRKNNELREGKIILEVKKELYDISSKNHIDNLENNIEWMRNKKLDELNNNNKKIYKFSKLVRNCLCATECNKKQNMCNVCVTNEINICLNPCGHTFCSGCVDKMNNSCAMCRKYIQNKIKIFLDNDIDENNDEVNYTDIEPFNGFADIAGNLQTTSV